MTVTAPTNEGTAPPASADLPAIAARIGAEVAGPAAVAVDREARFPTETFDALREARMLSVLVPASHGGAGARITDVALACEALAQHCGSSGLVYAMHHIQVACIARHGDTAWFQDHLRTIARDEMLLASATTELGTGGDVRSSICAVETDGDKIRLHKKTPVISYGRQSQCILATARRNADSPASEQVLAVFPIEQCTLVQTSVWDTLGFRGTCSDGFELTAEGSVDQVLTEPYAEVSAQTMLPVTHVLWASVWLGIARQAVTKARLLLRAEARRSPGTTPASARAVAELVGTLEQFTALVHGAARDFEEVADDHDVVTSMGFAIRMNTLKTSASKLLVEIVGGALTASGIQAYSEQSPYTMGMHLRDAYGAALMVHNERIFANTGQMLLVHKER